MLPSCEPCHKENGSYEGFSLPGGETIWFSPPEMLAYIEYVQKYAKVPPRTYWTEFPFYIIINSHKQQFCLGCRPEDLSRIDRIEQKSLKKHYSYLNRLERFPLDKAEYYLRLKETHAVNTVRGLSQITGEDWSYIARILRVTSLASPIKKFLKSNKENPEIIKNFHLRRLLDIVRQGEEKLQITRFRELIGECEQKTHA